MKTLEQERAADALSRVKELDSNDKDFKKLYRAYVDRLGPAIVMNGLGQALATELAAGDKKSPKPRDKAHYELYASVQCWLCRNVYPDDDNLLQAIVKNDESHYLRAQAEALAWLTWHKKFCRSVFPADNEGA